MKPAEHPEFFLRPPPPGRSRESSLRLDREGRFWHEGRLVEHAGMARAFARWLDRHPIDGRFVLNNGYDWTYIEVEDAPYQVLGLHPGQADAAPRIELTDGHDELLDPATLWSGEGGALYCLVRQRRFSARFSRAAQLALEPYLVETEEGEVALRVGASVFPVGTTPRQPAP